MLRYTHLTDDLKNILEIKFWGFFWNLEDQR